jgi:hypothetical protein
MAKSVCIVYSISLLLNWVDNELNPILLMATTVWL